MNSLVLALLVLATWAGAMARKPRVDKSMESHGAYSTIDVPGHRVITTPEEWSALWSDLKKKVPTGADFNHFFAVAAFAGTRNSGGYGSVFEAPKTEKDALVVRYVVTRPKGMATMALTQPYAVKFFPKTNKPLRVEGRNE